ncbi:cytochrome P450 4C1-like [Arctopsyche grandis]|uniref:cytochrome P450 4C1-like n=1 Tax=Arctopsyche grandis TaxID=121162 RepID=UPI00406D9504
MEQDEIDLQKWRLKDYLWTIVIATGVVYLVIKYLKWRIWASQIDLIPGPLALPIIGNAINIAANRKNVVKNIGHRFKTYGPIFRIWFGSEAVVAIRNAEDMEHLLNSTKNLKKSLLYKFVIQWLGDGLLTSSGAKWHTHRKLITPTFHYKMLENFHEIFVAKANIFVERLDSKSDTSESFDIYPFIARATLDVICETAMGTNVNAQNEEQSEYVKSVYSISQLITYRSRRLWLYADAIFKLISSGKTYFELLNVLHNYSRKIIQDRKISRSKSAPMKRRQQQDEETGMKNKTAFLDLLLKAVDDGANISENAIREEVDTFMFEGHDTTATGISVCLYLLGLHPEQQDRVANEIKGIMGDNERPITIKDVTDMKYLEMVIKEAMRLYPPVPLVGRDLEEDVKFGKYNVPAGTAVTLFFYYLHRDERYFPDPEKFDPDRFLAENVKGRHPYAYLPFSAGPRNCIGQKFALLEEKVIIATFLRKYKLTSIHKPDEIIPLFELVLKLENGIQILLEKRK